MQPQVRVWFLGLMHFCASIELHVDFMPVRIVQQLHQLKTFTMIAAAGPAGEVPAL
jgi:hypothetical protein